MANTYFRIETAIIHAPIPNPWVMRKLKSNHYRAIKTAQALAAGFAPRATGDLSRKFTARLSFTTPISTTYRLSNTAKYAKYVFTDTRGKVIRPRGSKLMPVGKSQMSRYRGRTLSPAQLKHTILKSHVEGYTANDAMTRAINIAFARQGIHF